MVAGRPGRTQGPGGASANGRGARDATRLAGARVAGGLRGPACASREAGVRRWVNGATHGAADGLRRADLGRIAVGAKADLCTIDVSGLLVGSGAVGPEPLNNLLYAGGAHVRHVITQGYVQLYDGQLVVDDETRVQQRGAAAVREIWGQLRAEGWFRGG